MAGVDFAKDGAGDEGGEGDAGGDEFVVVEGEVEGVFVVPEVVVPDEPVAYGVDE